MSEDSTSEKVSPATVIKKLSDATPDEFKRNIVVIGSIAAGYYYFGNESELQVQTKDIDCLLRPFVEAITAGEAITEALMDAGWTYAPTEEFPEPGNEATPSDKLPVVRLNPPGDKTWFVELLTVGEKETDLKRGFIPLETSHGKFGLCAFGGTRLAQWNPFITELGIAIARPEMMALSNLLHHKVIGNEKMSKSIDGESIKRSNKDLGRVLALAYLAERDQPDALLGWGDAWLKALKEYFPETWARLSRDAGAGLRALLSSELDFIEAHYTCAHGLVAVLKPTENTLRAAGERLLVDAIEPLERAAQNEGSNDKN